MECDLKWDSVWRSERVLNHSGVEDADQCCGLEPQAHKIPRSMRGNGSESDSQTYSKRVGNRRASGSGPVERASQGRNRRTPLKGRASLEEGPARHWELGSGTENR